ncbi:demethylmenaquinone methyltransferase [Mycobacterium avium subsp. hominissuis]
MAVSSGEEPKKTRSGGFSASTTFISAAADAAGSISVRCTPNGAISSHAEVQRWRRGGIPAPGSVKRVSRAELDKNPRDVASMFDGVARRYDLTNTVLSLGQDRYWRKATRSALGIGPGQKVLDLAAGTAVSTVELNKSGAWCVAADFSVGMLAAGAARRVPKVAGDATRLPFADDVFDAVTISFGLRNVVDTQAALREMARVTRPGGRLVVCEFSTPSNALFATVYKEYLMRALPRVARAVSSNPDAYVYLAESIRAWPDQAALADQIAGAGWAGVRWRNLTGGIVALHAAHRPSR